MSASSNLARGGERGEPAGIAAPHDARGSVVRCAICGARSAVRDLRCAICGARSAVRDLRCAICAQILAPAHDAAGVLGQVLAPGAIAAAAPVWGLPGP
ncbi:hypothetical protein [Gemmatimonas sp.]|uniref:hypothetical protein n=1 Tax=Gemmatimonas sp. TaxID=1962908 RepID=UPI00391FAB24